MHSQISPPLPCAVLPVFFFKLVTRDRSVGYDLVRNSGLIHEKYIGKLQKLDKKTNFDTCFGFGIEACFHGGEWELGKGMDG